MELNDYLLAAYEVARESNDPSTQNGALLLDDRDNIVARAANNFPTGVKETEERWGRPAKYFYVEHAERNVIFEAARLGVKTDGLVMLCPWAACADCARAIVAAGIETLVRHKRPQVEGPADARWSETIVAGDEILQEGGVKIIEVDPVGGVTLRRDGNEVDTSTL